VNGPIATLLTGVTLATALAMSFAACTQPTAPAAPSSPTGPATMMPAPAPAYESASARGDDAVARTRVDPPSAGADAETGTGTWSGREAAAFHMVATLAQAQGLMARKQPLAHLASAVPAPAARDVFAKGGVVSFDGYCYRMALSARDGTPAPDDQLDLVADGFVLYAWPTDGKGRAFCGYGGGVLYALHGGTYVGERGGPPLDAALSSHAAPTLGAGLRGPTLGRDGLRWQELGPPGRDTELRIRVLDKDRKVLPGFPVMVMPHSWLVDAEGTNEMAEHVLDTGNRPLPMGRATSSADGRIAIRGLPAEGMRLLTPENAEHILVEADTEGIVLVVTQKTMMVARSKANESAAIATLKNIASAQAQFQACGAQDTDGDGTGEYGFLAELAGAKPLRTSPSGDVGTAVLTPPVLSAAFGNVANHAVTRSGYMFQIWLPATASTAATELHEGGSASITLDSDLAEVAWYAYAWPAEYGVSGERAFFIGMHGDVFAAANDQTTYSGPGRRPQATAAVSRAWLAEPFSAQWEGKVVGSDGNVWQVIF